MALLQSIEALLQSSKEFMKLAAIKPLTDLLQLQTAVMLVLGLGLGG